MKKIISVVVAGLMMVSFIAAGTRIATASVAEVGSRPPLFALVDEDGKTQRLEDLLGKPIVLYFTHNMCHYCTQVIAYLKRAHAAYGEKGLTIVTVNVWADGSGKLIRRYKEQFGLPFRMLAGKNPQVLRDYEVNYVPIIVFIGRDGLVRFIDHHYVLAGDFEKRIRSIVLEE
ncbi:MAG: peroxiredoxin family protein [Candidatus Binatia bacterium]